MKIVPTIFLMSFCTLNGMYEVGFTNINQQESMPFIIKYFLQLGTEGEIASIEIHERNTVDLVMKDGRRERILPQFNELPQCEKKQLEGYLNNAYVQVNKLSDDNYKINANIRILGGKKRDLHKAIENEDIAKIKQIIQEDIIRKGKYTIEELDDNGRTPLALAVEKKNKEIINLLLQNGANVNKTFNWHSSDSSFYIGHRYILFEAFLVDIKIAKFLLEKGAEFNSSIVRGFLEFSELKPNTIESFEYCVSRINIDEINTLLGMACEKKRIPLIKVLLKYRADPDTILPSVYAKLDQDVRYILNMEGPNRGQNKRSPQEDYIPHPATPSPAPVQSYPSPQKQRNRQQGNTANTAINLLNAFAKVEEGFADDLNAMNSFNN